MTAAAVAILGMACRFRAAASLDACWHALVNGSDPYAASGPALPEPVALAVETLSQALADAGLPGRGPQPSGTVLIILGAGDLQPQERDGLAEQCRTTWGVTAAFDGGAGLTWCEAEGMALVVQIGPQGAAAVVLKPSAEAAKAGDQAYAIVCGRGTGPEAVAQALSGAAVAAAEIGLVDCWLNELGELAVLTGRLQALPGQAPQAQRPLAGRRLGAGGGLMALVQAALSLNNKLILPGDPAIAPVGQATPPSFYWQREIRPWIHDNNLPPRRLLLCRGVGEAGYALVLEDIRAPAGAAALRPRPVKTELDWDSELLVFSATTTAALAARLEALRRYLEAEEPASLADLAYSLVRRFDPAAAMRLAMVAKDVEDAGHLLEACLPRLAGEAPSFAGLKTVYFSADARPDGKVACMFPGQGFPGLLGPYVEHLYDLCLRFPEVREVFDGAELRDAHPEDPTPTSQIFFPPKALAEPERKRLRQRLASPRIADAMRMHLPDERDLSSFGVSLANWASWKLLQKFNVPVDMVFGQSYGELSALCAAGALDFGEFIKVHWKAADIDLGALIAAGGGMALASTSAEVLALHLVRYSDVSIAVHIAPGFQILGGPNEPLERLIGDLRADGIWTQSLPYPAIHTPRFTLVRPLMEPYLRDLNVRTLRIPAYSAMGCDVYPASPDAIRATVIANLDHPVLLWQTTRRMYQDGARIFIQVGGGATMYAQAKTNIGAEDVIGLSIDVDYRSALGQLNHLCGALLCQGVIHDVAPLFAQRTPRNLDIATEAEQTGPDAEEWRMPFIGEVTHYEAGREILLERTLDLSEDLHLRHHLFVSAEGIKPLAQCFPVLPMTVGLEWLAEAAACIAPGYGLVGFEEIKATRWIALVDREKLPMRAYARLHHYDADNDRLYIAAGLYQDAEDKAAIQGVVIFGRQYLETLRLPDVTVTDPWPYPWPDKAVYRERRLFHGPLFQCVAGETMLGERAATGYLEVLPTAGMFSSTRQPLLLADPILLDGVGQLIGLWAMEQGVYVFPISIARLEIYRPTPAVGTRVPVTLNISQYSHRFLSADIEIQDGEGGVWMRIQGWHDWVFHWTQNLFDFRRDPTRHCLSDRLDLPGLPDGAAARQVDSGQFRDMELAILARFYLRDDELRQFEDLAGVPPRQKQWLLGRIAVKDAVREWLRGAGTAPMMHPASFAIAHDERRCPLVRDLGARAPRISLAHSGERAVAIAHAEVVGIDLEAVAVRGQDVLAGFLTAAEASRLAGLPEPERDELATRIWCAKEAAGKAWGTGIEGSPKAYETTAPDRSGTMLVCHGGMSLAVTSQADSNYILAYAWGASEGWSEEEQSRGFG